ncbi:MAG: hypothetical protein ABSD56_15840 [Bryobacteraceae bacterium]
MPAPPARAIVVVVIVSAAAMAGALNYYQFLSAYSQAAADSMQIAAHQQRLSTAIAAIPPNVTVGYLSDVPPESPEGGAVFGAARYAVAPRPLVTLGHGREPDWVLGNFFRPLDAARTAAENRLAVAADYGSGVVLYRRVR